MGMIEDIKSDLARLIALYEGEKQRADRLEESLSASARTVEDCKKQIAELERQIDNQQLAGAFMTGESSAVAKERITRLIREIDKCISLLEN